MTTGHLNRWALIAVLATAACSSPTGTLPTSTAITSTSLSSVGTTATPAPSTDRQLVLPTATPITPTGRAAVPSTVPPAPTAPTAVTTNFDDPVAVARDWMTQWCSSDYREPRNNNVQRATVFSTPAAKAADLAAGDTEASYRSIIEQKLSSRCDRITAEISPEAPRSPDLVFVVLTASRIQLARDVAFQVLPVSTTRAVIRQADGRWLVDVTVAAG